MEVTLDNGKYCITMKDNKITATRHGEPWRDLTGDNLMYYLLLRNAELECTLYKSVQIAKLKECIKLAMSIREASWLDTGTSLTSKYALGIQEAAEEATKRLNLPKALAYPIYLNLYFAWNDIFEWSLTKDK